MIRLPLTTTFALAILFATTIASGQTDPVKSAEAENKKKVADKLIDKNVAEFLVKSADARMMDSYEGKLAFEKGTTSAIRDYGQLMIRDQATLLEEIKKLATDKNITLPAGISKKKQHYGNILASKEGKDFDKKFIKMITIDHKRDIRLFKHAAGSQDPEVSAFAQKYLPMIQSHLDKIIAIKNSKEQ